MRNKSELVHSTPSDRELLQQVLRIYVKPNECHRCGAETGLTRHEFAIAKVVSVKRAWGETIARAGLSAASIVAAPLTGFGVFSWKNPGKTTFYNLFKAELVLCRSCLSWAWRTVKGAQLSVEAYRCHPWAEPAGRIGYDKYLSPEELSQLKPSR